MLALICAAGPARRQRAKTHYASIMLEISMTALFTPKVPAPFACFCVRFLRCIWSHAQKQGTEWSQMQHELQHEHLTSRRWFLTNSFRDFKMLLIGNQWCSGVYTYMCI